MNYDFSNYEFKSLLKQKEQDIIKRTINGINENENFKQLYSSLSSYLKKSAKSDFKVIQLKITEFNKINTINVNNLYQTLNSHSCISNNRIEVDENFNIVNVTREQEIESSEAHRIFRELSKGYIVFTLHPNQLIHYFINGDDFGKCVFFSKKDYKSYDKKITIDQIDQIFKSYRQHLTNRNTYCKFFVSKSHLLSLRSDLVSSLADKEFINEFKHLLNNKPEDKFREDLREFLSKNLNATFLSKEYILDNFTRLDIYILDELGELYLIEVKWVGTSIHQNGKRIGTTYNEKDITPNAISQTVGYLKQLHNEGKNIKLGYLAVFDARKENLNDTGIQIQKIKIDEEDNKHYRKFSKIPDFRVINLLPS